MNSQCGSLWSAYLRVVGSVSGIERIIVRPHPRTEALYGRVQRLVHWKVVDVPEITTPTTVTMAVSSVVMTTVVMATITSVSYMYV